MLGIFDLRVELFPMIADTNELDQDPLGKKNNRGYQSSPKNASDSVSPSTGSFDQLQDILARLSQSREQDLQREM